MTSAEHYDLTLYINGASALSALAITDARRLCDTRLKGRCALTVVDLRDDPASVRRSQVLATPTLVRNGPPPVRRIVGDLSDGAKVLRLLELTDAG